MTKTYFLTAAVVLSALILFSPAFATTSILNIRHWAASDHTRIVIDTSEEAEIKVSKKTRSVTVDFTGAQYPDDMPLELILNKRGIERIRVTTLPSDKVKVELMLSDGAESSVFKLKEIQDKPFRVVIDLKFPDIEKKESEDRQKFKTAKKDTIIIIDPGHGGEDPGAVGPKKTMEKDVVLKIAKKLEWLLNNRKGYRAFLTRNGDYYPSFNKRLQIAREYGADLFISIHADASRSRQPYGSSVYCLSTKRASSEAARLLARQENLADIVGGSESEASSEESDPITLNMIQTETINLSKSFGTTILEHLKKFSAIHFPRIQEAPFIVLKLPHIPSILVETGYISNPKEELLLKNNRHQNRIALALCTSIQDFLHSPDQDKDAVQIALEEDREDAKALAQSATAQQEPESRPLPRMVLYKVKQGDTLNNIARKFNTSPAALLKLNNLQRSDPLANRRLKVYLPAGNGAKARIASAPPPDRADRKAAFHRVKRGESLSGIARKYGVSPSALASENRIKPEAPLLIDRNLKIPSASQPEQNTTAALAEKPVKPRIHIVKRGETLEKISRKYDVTVASLLKENNMKLKDNLWVDRKIRIP